MKGQSVKEIILKHFLLSLLIIVLLCSHCTMLAVNLTSYALENEADARNVVFKAYFKAEDNQKTKDIERTINSDDIILFLKVEVKNEGFLNNAEIELKDSNFVFNHEKKSFNGIESITDNKISLKQLNSGETLKIKIGLKLKDESTLNTSTFNKSEKVVLNGIYINAKQQEDNVEIEENVKISLVSPYSEDEEKINLNTEVITNKIYDIDGEKKRIVQLSVKSGLIDEGYPIKQTYLQIEAPKNAEKIGILERGTFATNGKKESDNTKETLKVGKEQNKVNIQITNPEKDEKINFSKKETDNFILVCVFDEKEDINESEIKTKVLIELYDEQNSIYEKENTNIIENEKDNIVNYEILSQSKIYKGKLYANEVETYKAETRIDIRYPRN